MSDYIDWPGASGKSYRYWFVENSTQAGLKSEGGNYAFVKQRPDRSFIPSYFGESGNLSDRVPGHPSWVEAKQLGATHIMAHTTPAGEQARRDEEQDLIAHWNPPLNKKHRTVG
jgi:hypothetical protein